ncbi:sugar ABC transporter substrate-binding protein [Microbacterium sp. Au-Mic1]|uniref:sugar ABC transporter substrate-binding protein n=1 Tax=Microbacterium sp. Au-Mic1 TaxID=2906457 RepID=UPI001E499106|nr:sugar ABC transporter substrate-binding protein [Microbacterium sp. Au-Mic1]MCE4026258.1 sugar ABC transporter substrate-binding protein [Microbacterium sp. Au-Mic1]
MAVALISAGALFLSGCSAGPADSANSDKPLTIGASVLGTEFPAVVALDKGMQEEARKLGVKLVIADAGGQASKQTNDVSDLVSQGVDGIVINAVDSSAIVASAQAALAAKIPLASAFTTLGTATCAYSGSVGHVGFNEQGWAKLQGQEAVKILPNGGNVAIIDGAAGLQSSKLRHDGFVKELEANPAIKVVASQPGNFDRTTALTAMENILQAHPDLSLVYAPDDNMAVGVIQAIKAAGKTGKIQVLGIGGSKDGLKAVQAGTMHSTVFSSLEQGGRQVIDAMVANLRGTDKKMEQCINVPQTLVDSSNIDKFMDKGEY